MPRKSKKKALRLREDQVNNLVRYIVNRAGSHLTFKESEIKNVIPYSGVWSTKVYEEIIERTSNILKNVYGYNLIVSDPSSNSSREYIISNALPYIEDPTTVDDEQYPENVYKVAYVAMLLILSHIFMSNDSVSKGSNNYNNNK